MTDRIQDEHRRQINANANSIITTAEVPKGYRGLLSISGSRKQTVVERVFTRD